MAKAKLKTVPTGSSVKDFIASIPDEDQRKDVKVIAALMQAATRSKPKMWGPAIIGFGDLHLKYASGRELDMPIIAFSPRKGKTVLYLDVAVFKNKALLKKLGPVKTGKCCLYLKSLEGIDKKALKELIRLSVAASLK